MTTTCNGCRMELDASAFYPSTLRSSGGKRCRSCMRVSALALQRSRGVAPRVFLFSSEEARECSACGEVKPLSEWQPSQVEARGRYCRACNHAYRRLRQAEPGYSGRIRNVQRQRNKRWFAALKAVSACTQCGNDHPAVLDWHHVDPNMKAFNLGWGVANMRPIAVLEVEAAKCVVLCANCHRIHHYTERMERRRARLAQSA